MKPAFKVGQVWYSPTDGLHEVTSVRQGCVYLDHNPVHWARSFLENMSYIGEIPKPEPQVVLKGIYKDKVSGDYYTVRCVENGLVMYEYTPKGTCSVADFLRMATLA
jgi:hypothetical protein